MRCDFRLSTFIKCNGTRISEYGLLHVLERSTPRYRENEFSPTLNSSTSTDIQWPDIETENDIGSLPMIELDSIARMNLNE
jgi:hypothetical protein